VLPFAFKETLLYSEPFAIVVEMFIVKNILFVIDDTKVRGV